MSVVAIVQARLGSTRLPRKVLANFNGELLLSRVLRRVQSSRLVESTLVATSTASADKEISEYCSTLGVPCFRGSEDDVLNRFAMAAEDIGAKWIVRVNADNPFIAPQFLDNLIASCLNSGIDYASYKVANRPAMLTPVGLFAELISRECLDHAESTLTDQVHREHVTLGIYQTPEIYRLCFLEAPDYTTDPRLRMTIDTQEDFDLMQEIASSLTIEGEPDPRGLCKYVLSNNAWTDRMTLQNLANVK